MSQNPQSLVKVDGQALADAVNKRLESGYSRQYIASAKAGGIGHKALKVIIHEEESRIMREALEASKSA